MQTESAMTLFESSLETMRVRYGFEEQRGGHDT
jgi:hypothetical protein